LPYLAARGDNFLCRNYLRKIACGQKEWGWSHIPQLEQVGERWEGMKKDEEERLDEHYLFARWRNLVTQNDVDPVNCERQRSPGDTTSEEQ